MNPNSIELAGNSSVRRPGRRGRQAPIVQPLNHLVRDVDMTGNIGMLIASRMVNECRCQYAVETRTHSGKISSHVTHPFVSTR